MAGAIETRLDIDIDDVKVFLKVENDVEDSWFNDVAIPGVKQLADAVCQSEFLDADGKDEYIPEAIRMWCMERIGRAYELRANGLVRESVSMLGSVEWDKEDMSILMRWRNYDGTSAGAGVCPI